MATSILTPLPTLKATYTPAPTPVPSPTSTPTPSPVPTPDGLLGGRFANLLTDEVIGTDTSYGCRNLYVSIRSVIKDPTYAERDKYVASYFVADIYVQDIEDLRTEAAESDFSLRKTTSVKRMADRVNAIVAVSGDYYTHDHTGIVLRNGELFRSTINAHKDICVLYRDGTMRTFPAGQYDLETIRPEDAWQVWSFGPPLLDDNGQPLTEFDSSLSPRNPRCAIGYFEPGHYCLVLVDGRQPKYSNGVSLKALSQLMFDLGCKVAYNLDGGGSAQMYWNGRIHNSPTGGGRLISDIIYVAFPTQ